MPWLKTTGYILMETTRLATASVISSREEDIILSVSQTDFRHHPGNDSISDGNERIGASVDNAAA